MAVEGWFWHPDTPDKDVPGKLVCSDWQLPALQLDAVIVEPKSIRGLRNGLIDMGDPDDVVANFQPITIHGTVTEGNQPLTIFAANPHGPQYYSASHAVIGGHFADEEVTFEAVRFQLDNDALWSHLRDAAPATGDLGTVSRVALDGSEWFVFRANEPMTLRDLGRRALIACRSAARLALQPDLNIGTAFVQESNSEAWLPWYSQSTASSRIRDYKADGLVSSSALSLQLIADWLAVSATMRGLDAAIADQQFPNILELRGLLLGSIAEGLHRRLFEEGTARFEGLSRADARKVRNAAKGAISAALQELGIHAEPDEFNGLVAPLNQFSFQQRLESIKAVIDEVMPDMLMDCPSWPTVIKNVRNEYAHWLLDDEDRKDATTEEKLLAYQSLPWVLRTLLLYRAMKIDAAVLREAYNEKDEYGILRAYIRQWTKANPDA